MQRLQYGALQSGYSYFDGNEASWPLSPVMLMRNERILLCAVWDLDKNAALREFWSRFQHDVPGAGLLLVGTEPVEAPAIAAIFAETAGEVSYVDAQRGQLRVRLSAKTPASWQPELDRVLHATENDTAAATACRTALHAHLAERTRSIAPARGGGQRAPKVPIPLVSYTLIALCVLVYVVSILGDVTHNQFGISTDMVQKLAALHGPEVRTGQWWRLLSHAFLHGGLIHLGFNMFALYAIGGPLEQWQGRWRMAVFFFFSALTGALVALWWTPNAVMVGASGGLFGLLGAMGALLLRYRNDLPASMHKGLAKWLLQILGINFIISLMPGISMAAHFGGLVGGFLIGLIITRSPVKREAFPSWCYAALLVLLAATAYFGAYVIQHIPLNLQPLQ
jgi:membrane associated rhomboid family serine protease